MVFSGISAVSFEVIRCSLPLYDRHRSTVASNSYKEAVVVVAKSNGHLGFGELAPLPMPFYEEQYLDGAQKVLTYLLSQLSRAFSAGKGFDLRSYREIVGRVRGWSSAKFAIDIALADLNGRIEGIGPFETLQRWCGANEVLYSISSSLARLDRSFGVRDFIVPPQGTSVGDFASLTRKTLNPNSYRRIKIKVDASKYNDLSHFEVLARYIREVSPEFEVVIDFNETGPSKELLESLLHESVSFFEAPYRVGSIEEGQRLFRDRSYRVAFDESLKDDSRLIDFMGADLFDVAVLKPHRFGSIADLLKAIVRLTAFERPNGRGIGFYFGGMYDTPILRRLMAVLAALFPDSEASDLGPDRDYFSAPILPSVVAVDQGLKVVGGVGLTGAFAPGREHTTLSLKIEDGYVQEVVRGGA